MTPRVGLEPTTPRLTAVCSTIELSRIILGTFPPCFTSIPLRMAHALLHLVSTLFRLDVGLRLIKFHDVRFVNASIPICHLSILQCFMHLQNIIQKFLCHLIKRSSRLRFASTRCHLLRKCSGLCFHASACRHARHSNTHLTVFSSFWSSPRPISTPQLHALLHFHPEPINLVVFKGSYSFDGISYLEGGFTLRCLQRLSLPDLATLPWLWQANRYTSGPSIPVLSY